MATNNEWEDAPTKASHDGWEDAPDEGILAKLGGGLEAAANFATGIPAALGGGLNYLGTLAATQNPDAALAVKNDTEKAINDKIQYDPRTAVGKRYEQNLGKGFQNVIEAGGPALHGVVRSIPFVGEDLAKDNKEGLDAIGKAYSEMALNVADPLLAVKGVKAGMKRFAKDTPELKIADPRVEPTGGWEDAPTKQNSAADRGTPGQAPGDQGNLFSPEGPATQPMGEAGQGDLFGGMPPKFGDTTMAHVDDFAVANPYDMGGHVSASDQGHPTTIDNPQGELFGGQSVEQPPATPVDPNSMVHTPAEPPAPMQAELTGLEPTPPNAMTNAMREAQTDATFRQRDAEAAAKKQADADSAYAEAERQKQTDYAKMEAQRELEHMNMVNSVESTPARNFFTDPANRDKLDLQEVRAYHGTKGDFDELRPTTQGQFGPGIYTTLSPEEAGMYANSSGDGSPNIRPVNVDLKNPLEVHADTSSGAPRNWFKKYGFNRDGDPLNAKRVAELKAQGHDGVIAHQPEILGVNPDGSLKLGKMQTHYVAFDSDRVKSVFGDRDFAGEHLGDKSLMGPEHTQLLVDALRRGDFRGALETIKQNHFDPAYRHLADYLQSALSNVNIRVHDEGIMEMGDRHATGYYDPETHTVGLSRVGAVSPHTVLHELVHAMTSDFVNTRPNDLRVIGLKDLFNKLNDLGMQKEFPAITNVKEFLAEAFSSPEFQKYLQEHKLQDRSTWRRFVDNVKSLLGISTSARNSVTNALEHVMDLGKQIMDAKSEPQGALKDAGVPGKLADLMVTRQPERPNQVVNNGNMEALKGLGKLKAQFDFTPLKPEEIIKMAKEATDIPKGALETLKANLDAGGRMASLRHSNNPVIKYTFAHMDSAIKTYEKWIRDNITDTKTGIKSMLRNLSEDDFTAVHSQLMLDEGQLERTPQQMRVLGWTEKMVEAAQRIRQVDKEMLDKVNEARASMNPPLPPIDRRIGHLAGRFMGDFYHTVYSLKPDGTREKAVMMITGSTKWGAQKIADHITKEHPEWEISKQEYKGIRQGNNSDRFSGFMELMSFIAHKDKEVAKALDSLDKYNRNAATNYLNQLRHAKAKKVQPGGVIGSEGHKAWVDAKTNAEEGFKGHMAYLDTSAKWVEMQKAMGNISKVITDKDVAMQMPNAVKWSTAYTDHALHRNQGWMTSFAQSLLSEAGRVTGVGHSNITKGVNTMSTYEMRKWMGIGNIPFALKHLLLPFQKMPAMMAYMHTVGGLDPVRQGMAGLKSLNSYVNYLKKDADVSPFEKQAFKYAQDNNVMNVNLDNLSGRIQSGKTRQVLGRLADLDFSGPEHAIRGNSFFFYAHLLHDAGMEPHSAFSAAEHLTKFLYTDYAPHEAPRAAAKAGWLGQLAFQVTRYKMNEVSQVGFFGREAGKGMTDADHSFMKKLTSNAPLMTHIASTLAFTGVVGMMGYNEMDHLYSTFRKYVMGNPDNLMALLQRSNAPEMVKYGLFSKVGIDPKIDESHLIPAPFPTTTSQIEGLGKAWEMARYHDAWHTKQFMLSQTPSTFRGLAENHFFTQPQETQGEHAGKSLYLNPNTGEGRVWRTPEQQSLRNYGFHTTSETNETNTNYAISRIEGDNKDLAEHVITKAKGLIASGSLTAEKAQELAQEYAKHQQKGQPNFWDEVVAYDKARSISQGESMRLKAASGNGIGNANSLNIMQRNK